MSSPSDPSKGHDFTWSSYAVYRPAYPNSLWTLILDYHKSHHDRYEAAHDVGAGAGQASAKLAEHFGTVYISDPSEKNVEAAKANLLSDEFQRSLLPRTVAFQFSVTPAEEAWRSPGSVDIVTFFESIHWTSATLAIEQAAQQLKPGGTLAIAFYSPECHITSHPQADSIWKQILALTLDGVSGDGKFSKPVIQGRMGLDFVPLPEQWFEKGARRVNVNSMSKGSQVFGNVFSNVPLATSRIGESDYVEDTEDDNWTQVVHKVWFQGFIQTLQVGEPKARVEVERLFEEVNKQLPGDGIEIEWSVAVILASKRGDIA